MNHDLKSSLVINIKILMERNSSDFYLIFYLMSYLLKMNVF